MVTGSVSHIHKRNVVAYLNKSAITFDSASSIDQEQGSASIFRVKNLTITRPKSEIALVNFWGSDVLDTLGSGVPATGTFQIQAMEEQSWQMAKATFTAVFSHDELGSTTPNGNSFEVLLGNAGIDITDSPAFTRYTHGDYVTNPRITVGNLAFIWNNGSGIINASMSNVLVNINDIKIGEESWEFECEANCLARDCVIELED